MRPRIVTIGASLGGFEAMTVLLGGLSKGFPLPIVMIQHRSPSDQTSFVPLLSTYSKLPIQEVNDKDPILPGNVYVAPASYHLLIEEKRFVLSMDEPVMHARPSIDVLFETAAESYGPGVIGVLLTGSSADGTVGAMKIKQAGGLVIVQDPATAEGSEMPRSAIASVQVDRVLGLSAIAKYLTELVMDEVEHERRENKHTAC